MTKRQLEAGANNLAKYRESISKEEQLQKSANGGKKCGENKRKRKAMKEYLEALLLTNTESGDYLTDITLAIINKALNGDVKAYEVIRDTLGESPKQQVELSSADTISINITGEDEH